MVLARAAQTFIDLATDTFRGILLQVDDLDFRRRAGIVDYGTEKADPREPVDPFAIKDRHLYSDKAARSWIGRRRQLAATVQIDPVIRTLLIGRDIWMLGRMLLWRAEMLRRFR